MIPWILDEDSKLTVLSPQPQRIGAARVRLPHGAEADEGIYDCMYSLYLRPYICLSVLEMAGLESLTRIPCPVQNSSVMLD